MIRKLKIAIRILVIVLFCLIFFAINTTFLTRAKAIKVSNSPIKTGSTAQYVFLSSPSETKNLVIDCSKKEDIGVATWTANYPFSVSNTNSGKVSDVGISYEILITLPKALVSGITMDLISGNVTLTPKQKTSTTFLYDGYETLPAFVSKTHSYALKFTVNAEVIVDSFELNNISIDINSSQID
jgi:hypothetical protein